ncbi:unnamed protein product, partial [Ectocarpus fasciculatus]
KTRNERFIQQDSGAHIYCPPANKKNIKTKLRKFTSRRHNARNSKHRRHRPDTRSKHRRHPSCPSSCREGPIQRGPASSICRRIPRLLDAALLLASPPFRRLRRPGRGR